MNRKERRATGIRVAKPALKDLVSALGLAAPWIVRTRWPPQHAHSLEMSFAGREVLRRFQYGAEMAACVLLIGNGATALCVGDSRSGYDLLVRRGTLGPMPPYEQWRSAALFTGDANGTHTVVKAHGEGVRAFADLTFGHVAVATQGAIRVPPVFASIGPADWPTMTLADVMFQYAPAPEPPDMHHITVDDWIGLIDDFETLVRIALGCRNDEAIFLAEMQAQMQQVGRG
jgi:hypothetical protein